MMGTVILLVGAAVWRWGICRHMYCIYCVSTPGGVRGHRVQPVPALPRLVTHLQVAEHGLDPSLLSVQITVVKSVGYDPQIPWLLYKISSLPYLAYCQLSRCCQAGLLRVSPQLRGVQRVRHPGGHHARLPHRQGQHRCGRIFEG